MKKTLEIWTIYNKPKDFPDRFVARKFYNDQPTQDVIVSEDLENLRAGLREKGLTLIPRSEFDPPVIVESWLD